MEKNYYSKYFTLDTQEVSINEAILLLTDKEKELIRNSPDKAAIVKFKYNAIYGEEDKARTYYFPIPDNKNTINILEQREVKPLLEVESFLLDKEFCIYDCNSMIHLLNNPDEVNITASIKDDSFQIDEFLFLPYRNKEQDSSLYLETKNYGIYVQFKHREAHYSKCIGSVSFEDPYLAEHFTFQGFELSSIVSLPGMYYYPGEEPQQMKRFLLPIMETMYLSKIKEQYKVSNN